MNIKGLFVFLLKLGVQKKWPSGDKNAQYCMSLWLGDKIVSIGQTDRLQGREQPKLKVKTPVIPVRS